MSEGFWVPLLTLWARETVSGGVDFFVQAGQLTFHLAALKLQAPADLFETRQLALIGGNGLPQPVQLEGKLPGRFSMAAG